MLQILFRGAESSNDEKAGAVGHAHDVINLLDDVINLLLVLNFNCMILKSNDGDQSLEGWFRNSSLMWPFLVFQMIL